MFEFLNSNPLIVLGVGVVIVFVLMFVMVKAPKSKKKTKQEPDKKEKTDKTEEKNSDEKVEKTTDSNEEHTIKKKKHLKKAKNKPEVTQVYKRTIMQPKSSNEIKDENNNGIDDDLEQRAQFVKTSNKVSKFIGLSDIVNHEETEMVEEGFSEMPVSDFDENCDDCKKQVKHFDHSRRLSKMIQEDSFDDMLESHISDKYLKINAEKHLGVGTDFAEKLYKRAMDTISNSDVKVLVESETEEKPVEQIRNDKDYMKEWLAERRRNELSKLMNESSSYGEEVLEEEFVEKVKTDIDLSPKNIVVVDALLKRKTRNKK